MGENAKKIGDKLELWGGNLFRDFQWTEIAQNVEMKCNRKSAHKNKSTHGIDLLCSFSDPYSKFSQGVIIECKNRQMKSINQTHVDAWIEELQNSIECSHAAPELAKYRSDSLEISTGLLLIHANDNYDSEKMRRYLRGATMRIKRTKMSIYVATNDHIDMWQSLVKYVKSLKGEFSFVYPSINESNIREEKYITLNYLFSRYLFAENITQETQSESNGLVSSRPKRTRIMFCFDSLSLSSFQYMWSMFKHFQFGGRIADKYMFVFYPSTSDDAEFVRSNFIKSLSSGIPHPIEKEDQDKIVIEFLDNRHLSPVDN